MSDKSAIESFIEEERNALRFEFGTWKEIEDEDAEQTLEYVPDEELDMVIEARALKAALGKCAKSHRIISDAIWEAMIQAEQTKSYFIDGSESPTLRDWIGTIPEMDYLINGPQADYFLRMVTSVVTMIVPILQMNIVNPATGVNITVDEILDAGPRVLKDMPYHFASAEDKEEAALALVNGGGQEFIRKSREAADSDEENDEDGSESGKIKTLHPKFMIRNTADGKREIRALLTIRELSYVEELLRGAAEFEYGSANDD